MTLGAILSYCTMTMCYILTHIHVANDLIFIHTNLKQKCKSYLTRIECQTWLHSLVTINRLVHVPVVICGVCYVVYSMQRMSRI